MTSSSAGASGALGSAAIGAGAGGLSGAGVSAAAAWARAAMPLEPGLRRGNNVTDGPDVSAPFWFAGSGTECCPVGSPAGSVVAMALASLVLGDDTDPGRPCGPAERASTVGGR